MLHRELDGDRADAGRAAVHEQQLPRLERRQLEDVGPDGADDLGQPGGLEQRHPRRDRQELTGRHRDQLGVAPAGQQRAHLLADHPVGDAVAEGDDAAGALEPGVGRGAGWWVVQAHPLHDVGAVDGGRRDLDEHLTRSGDGVRDVGGDEGVGVPRGRQGDGAHGATVGCPA